MIYDLHNDYLTSESFNEQTLLKFNSHDSEVKIIYAVWTSESKISSERLKKLLPPKLIANQNYAIEDLGAIEDLNINKFFDEFKPSYVSLTWNGENILGGGCGYEAPLTEKGKKALKAMRIRNIPLDISHLSDIATKDVLSSYDGKILVTHTAARSLYPHRRNVTDEVAREIALRGGIIGVAAVADFLSGEGSMCSVMDYVKHLEYFAELVGIRHVAIGSDFYGTKNLPENLKSYDDYISMKEILKSRNWTEEEIENIFYKNAQSFFEK